MASGAGDHPLTPGALQRALRADGVFNEPFTVQVLAVIRSPGAPVGLQISDGAGLLVCSMEPASGLRERVNVDIVVHTLLRVTGTVACTVREPPARRVLSLVAAERVGHDGRRRGNPQQISSLLPAEPITPEAAAPATVPLRYVRHGNGAPRQ